MALAGGQNIVVKLYEGSTPLAPLPASSLIQTININLPDLPACPVPNLVTAGTPTLMVNGVAEIGGNPTSPQDWWAYSRNGCVAPNSVSAPTGTYPGRLNYIPNIEASGTVGIPADGEFFRNDNNNYDVVRTVLPAHGDYRLVAANPNVPVSVFQPHPLYTSTAAMMASNLTQSFEGNPAQGFDTRGKYISTLTYPVALAPDIPYTASTATPPLTPEATGDYDSALPRALDGPYINKPDEGNIWNNSATAIPYFASANYGETPGNTFFSPNRMMPSPGMFGSLPTGVISGSAWQTLLFRPSGRKVS